MNFDLNSFEQQIPENILARGLTYYKKGCVTDVTETSAGEFEAVVQGTENYRIRFQLLGHEVVDPVCSCPSDGPVCKHVAALIFYVFSKRTGQQEEPDATPKKVKKKKAEKAKTDLERVKEISEKLSAADMRSFCVWLAEADDDFARNFLSHFAHLSEGHTQKSFARQIRTALRSLKDRQGYIDYYKGRQIFQIGNQFLEPALRQLREKHYSIAWQMAAAGMEVFVEAFEYADDSNGDLGDCIRQAEAVMELLLSEPLPEDVRLAFFDWCFSQYKKGSFKGWDQHEKMMDICIGLVKTKKEATALMDALMAVQPIGKEWDWNLRQAEMQQYRLMQKTDSAAAAEDFLHLHLHNPDLRKEAIQQAIDQNHFDVALRLAKEGLQQDEQHPGLAEEWRIYLLRIYRLTNKDEMVKPLALHLLTTTNNSIEEYYRLLQQVTPEAEWPAMVDRILEALQHSKKFCVHQMAQICIWENRHEGLFQLLQQNSNFPMLDAYEAYLPETYQQAVNELYLSAISEMLETHVDRRRYQEACSYLRRVKKRGGRDVVAPFVEALKLRYQQRTALLEELALV